MSFGHLTARRSSTPITRSQGGAKTRELLEAEKTEKARLLRTASMTKAKTCSKLERKLTAARSFREQLSVSGSSGQVLGGALSATADDDLSGLAQTVMQVDESGDSEGDSDGGDNLSMAFGRVSMAFEEVVGECPNLVRFGTRTLRMPPCPFQTVFSLLLLLP